MEIQGVPEGSSLLHADGQVGVLKGEYPLFV
jgi:hypothetical protein